MSIKALNAAFELEAIRTYAPDGTDGPASIPAKFLLITLADYADDAGRAWPSQATVAKRTSMSERTIRDAYALLERRGLIRRHPRRNGQGERVSDVNHLIFLLPAGTAGSDSSRSGEPPPPILDDVTNRQEPPVDYRQDAPPLPAGTAGNPLIEPPLEESHSLARTRTREAQILDIDRLKAIAGDALADPAVTPGVWDFLPLRGLLTADPPCSLEDDIYPAALTASVWFKGRKGARSMMNWDLARKMALENRDRRLAGAPPVREIDHERYREGEPRRTSDRTESRSQANLDALARAANRRAAP